MRDRIYFFLIAALGALTISPLSGILGVCVAYTAGVRGNELVILFGSATGAVFTGLMMLAGLAAALFYSSKD